MKYNFYKRKLRILESFYMTIEQGNSYDMSVNQCLYYNRPKNDLDAVLIPITIATRYARTNRTPDSDFVDKLKEVIKKAKGVNLQEYELADDEIKVFNEELVEIERFINRQ